MAYAPRFDVGVPIDWVTPGQVEYRKERSIDAEGFRGVAPDPNDPPCFESQGSYLARHGLLSADERSRLTPEAFAPEALTGQNFEW
jgi:hypothetical protein